MKFNRRRFLRQAGLASSGTLLAAIGGRLATTVAAPDAMDRFLIVNVHGNSWWPKIIRPLNVQSETEWDFNDPLEPLASYRERIVHIERLYNPFGGLHGNYNATLTMVAGPEGNSPVPHGISIDRHIAKSLGQGMPFDSINLGHPYGHSKTANPGPPSNVSADGRGQVYPSLSRPGEIIDRLFANATGEPNPEAEMRLRMKTSLLDVMTEDIASSQGRLAGSERAAMDQYLGSVRDLEKRFAELEAVTCQAPAFDGPDSGLNRDRGQILPEMSHFLFHSASTALTCGLTRVLTIANEGVGAEPLQPSYPFAAVDMTKSLHDGTQHRMNGLNNEDNAASDRAWAAQEKENVSKVRNLYRWRSQQVADLFDRLSSVDLGGPSLADRTLMMWTNTGGGRHHRGNDDIPVLLVGNPDGVLNSGRYQRLGSEERSMSDVFTAVATAMGVPTESFGTERNNKGPLPGLLA